MKKIIIKILKELKLYDKILSVDENENKNNFFQKIITIKFKNHDDKLYIILNAYNKEEFLKNDYSKEIQKQILENKYLFEN